MKIEIRSNPWNQTEKKEKKNRTIEFGSSSLWQEVEKKEPAQKKVEFGQQSWNEISGLQNPVSIRAFEGENTLDSFSIKESQATRDKNISNRDFPAIGVRDGFSIFHTLAPNSIQGLAVYKGIELHVVAGGTWYALKGGTWRTVMATLDPNAKFTFIHFQGNFNTMHMIATNGVDPPMKYNGETGTWLYPAPTVADFVATHDNRVYIAASSTIHYSALRKAEDWNTVGESGSIVVETSDGGEITGIIAGSARLTVFKENSIHELFGTRPDNFTMKIVTESLGTPTGRSAQVIDGVIYFLGNDNIYRYSGGSLPEAEFALPVRKHLQELNKFHADKCVSWTRDNKYYLAIPKETSELNTILEYDPFLNTWHEWDIPEPVTAGGVVLDDKLYLGTKSGKVYESGGATDEGIAIRWEWVTKPFSLASLAQKSRWYRLWIVAKIEQGSVLNIHVSDQKEGENWTQVKTITGDGTETKAREIFIPVTTAFHSNWLRLRLEGTGKVTIYEISRQERVFPMGQ